MGKFNKRMLREFWAEHEQHPKKYIALWGNDDTCICWIPGIPHKVVGDCTHIIRILGEFCQEPLRYRFHYGHDQKYGEAILIDDIYHYLLTNPVDFSVKGFEDDYSEQELRLIRKSKEVISNLRAGKGIPKSARYPKHRGRGSCRQKLRRAGLFPAEDYVPHYDSKKRIWYCRFPLSKYEVWWLPDFIAYELDSENLIYRFHIDKKEEEAWHDHEHSFFETVTSVLAYPKYFSLEGFEDDYSQQEQDFLLAVKEKMLLHYDGGVDIFFPMHFIRDEADGPVDPSQIVVKVIGVGESGNQVLQCLAEDGFTGIDMIAVDTDARALAKMKQIGASSIQIGESLTTGTGTNGNTSIGEAAAKESARTLKESFADADIVFLTAGMGGGTGTGALPVIAKLAEESGVLRIGIVTMPFTFEGDRKRKMAAEGIAKMQSCMDALIVIEDDSLLRLRGQEKPSEQEAFQAADSVLQQGIRLIPDLIKRTDALINIDFEDVMTILRKGKSSYTILGIGESQDGSVIEAVRNAISSPLMGRTLRGARGIILNIVTPDENMSLMSLTKIQEAVKYMIDQALPVDPDVIYGAVIEKGMGSAVRTLLLATNFEDTETETEVPRENSDSTDGCTDYSNLVLIRKEDYVGKKLPPGKQWVDPDACDKFLDLAIKWGEEERRKGY